jgi:putative holliday junction resolvase
VAEARADATTVLAFDFGARRIGVAVGNTVVRIAHPLATIAADANVERFAAIQSLVAQWQPGLLVVGCPVHADGTEHEMTARAERFARQLEGRFRLPVVRADERYTTRVADSELSEAGVRGMARRAARDAAAARLILQGWFDDEERVDARGPA